MKILYLKGCKWTLPQNQRVRNDFFGYRRYEELAKHTKPFLSNKVKGRQCPYNKLKSSDFMSSLYLRCGKTRRSLKDW